MTRRAEMKTTTKPRVSIEDKFYMAFMRNMGYSYGEIAKEFGKNPSAIRQSVLAYHDPTFNTRWNASRTSGASYLKTNPTAKATNTHLTRMHSIGIRDEYVANEEKVIAIYELAYRLTKETGIEYQVDHIRPIDKGGEHSVENLQVIPATKNNEKNDRWDSEIQTYYMNTIFND